MIALVAAMMQCSPVQAQAPRVGGSPTVMSYSAQLDNPLLYGVISALTLGQFPSSARFGYDSVPRIESNHRWTQDMADRLRPVALRSFEAVRLCTWGLLICGALVIYVRRRKATLA